MSDTLEALEAERAKLCNEIAIDERRDKAFMDCLETQRVRASEAITKNEAESKAELDALDARIAALRKPPEKFPPGTKAMLPVTVRAVDGDTMWTHLCETPSGQRLRFDPSDLAATPTPTVTREWIWQELKRLDLTPCGLGGYTVSEIATSLADRLGATPEPQPATISRDRILEAAMKCTNEQLGSAWNEPLNRERLAATLADALGAAPEPKPMISRERILDALQKFDATLYRNKGAWCSNFATCLAKSLGAVPEPPKPAPIPTIVRPVHPVVDDDPKPTVSREAIREALKECAPMYPRWVNDELAETVADKVGAISVVSREAILAALRETPVVDIYGDWLARVATELAARLAEPKGA